MKKKWEKVKKVKMLWGVKITLLSILFATWSVGRRTEVGPKERSICWRWRRRFLMDTLIYNFVSFSGFECLSDSQLIVSSHPAQCTFSHSHCKKNTKFFCRKLLFFNVCSVNSFEFSSLTILRCVIL